MKLKNFFPLLLSVTLLTGCDTYQKVIYLQDAGKAAVMTDTVSSHVPDAVLKVGDLLTITVNSNTAEAAMPFNLPLVPTLSMQDYNPSRSTISNYSGGLQKDRKSVV